MAQSLLVMTPTTQLTTSAVVMYTQQVNSKGQVVRATVYNTDTVARQVTVHRVASGDTPGTDNVVLSGLSGRVMAGQAMVIDVLAGMILDPGDTIQALADAANVVNFTMSGYNNT